MHNKQQQRYRSNTIGFKEAVKNKVCHLFVLSLHQMQFLHIQSFVLPNTITRFLKTSFERYEKNVFCTLLTSYKASLKHLVLILIEQKHHVLLVFSFYVLERLRDVLFMLGMS